MMKRYKTMDEVTYMLRKAQDTLKDKGYDLKKDEWFVVRMYTEGHFIIYKLVVEDGVRKVKVEVSNNRNDIEGYDILLDTKSGALDAFDDEGATNDIFRDVVSKLNQKLGANRWSAK